MAANSKPTYDHQLNPIVSLFWLFFYQCRWSRLSAMVLVLLFVSHQFAGGFSSFVFSRKIHTTPFNTAHENYYRSTECRHTFTCTLDTRSRTLTLTHTQCCCYFVLPCRSTLLRLILAMSAEGAPNMRVWFTALPILLLGRSDYNGDVVAR